MREGTLLFSLLCSLGLAQARRPGATFLLIPPDARSTGMAYAYTALANNAAANYYNAAGLAFLESPSITTTYFTYLTGLSPDMRYVYVGAAYPLSKSAWGFDFIYYTPGTVEVWDPEGHLLGEHLIWRIAPKISYACRLSSKIALGMSWKFIHQQYGAESMWDGYLEWTGSSWAFDANLLYRILPNLDFGFVLHNFGPDISFTDNEGSDPLPRLFRLGAAYKPIENKYVGVTISAEVTKVVVGMFADSEKSFWENLDYEIGEAWKGAGLEVSIYRIVSLRGGYFYDEEGRRKGFTFGGGISYKGLAFDIGIDESIFDFETQNRKLSLTYTF